MNKRVLMLTFAIMLLVAISLGFEQTATALDDCSFSHLGNTMILQGDCETDQTIFIPDGYTLYGNRHKITAVDPPDGHFLGAVVKNEGATAHVKKLTIDTDSLANVCDSDADRLRGILFDGASGSIKWNRVLNINQGDSGCQEGIGIEVRNEPFDGTHPDTKVVAVCGNTVSDYQKGGIVANGDVKVYIEFNKVAGFGPVDFIAQNGIQLSRGAIGRVKSNRVSGNIYTGPNFASGGVLLFLPNDGSNVSRNKVYASDVGIWVVGTDSTTVKDNEASNSTYDGIAVDNQAGPADNNKVLYNRTNKNDVGVGLYGATGSLVKKNYAKGNTSAGFYVGFGATDNDLLRNLAKRNNGDGILIEANSNSIIKNLSLKNNGIGISIDGENNDIRGNISKGNGDNDINNSGDNNTYDRNKCNSSSGSPVDCGASPFFEHVEVEELPAPQPY